MKKLNFVLLFVIVLWGCKQQPVPYTVPNLNNLYLTSDAESRSISAENITGAKGGGDKVKATEGNAKRAAAKHGWKANPYLFIEPDEEKVIAEAEGPGVINHIWMTPGRDGNDRLRIIRIYWDDETEPSVEVPIGDFFCNAWGSVNQTQVNSSAIVVNPLNGFNSFWQMPFKKKFKITLTNLTKSTTTLYYQVDYTLAEVPSNAAYFHAQFRRNKKVDFKKEYVIVDGIKGKGQYVGTFLSRGTRDKSWWGEGEVKIYIDGDTDYPTYHGTGEEDYFLASYAYKKYQDKGWGNWKYVPFDSPYSGFSVAENHFGYEGCFGQYRWHIFDPVRFKNDFKINIQCLGWDDKGNYLPLEDDMSSVAYWYQTEPHNPFPELPSVELLNYLDEKSEDEVKESN